MRRHIPRVFALIAALGLLAVGVRAQPIPFPGGTAVHALTLNVDEGGQISVAGYTAAQVRETPASEPVERAAQALQEGLDRDYDLVTVQLTDDATGAVVFETTTTLAKWIRGEFALDPNNLGVTGAEGSNISGTHLPWRNRTLSVKVPVIAGANRLAVSLPGSGRSSSLIDLAATAANFGTRGVRDDAILIPLDGYTNGDPANRVDIVILGDGYTAAQQADFETDAQALVDGLFTLSPYSNYANYFNAVGVYGASVESGADQPLYVPGCLADTTHEIACCPDNSSLPALNGFHKDTRYDTTYCYDGIARLMVATDYAKMYADADAVYPDWDEIFIVANDSLYGGSGGAVAAVSHNTAGVQILQHEVGHSLIRLDDEYNTFTPGFPACSDKGRQGITTKCRPNVTDQTVRSQIKWARWILPSTAIPTTAADLTGTIAGLWVGAHYQPDTYYRPCYNCTMKSLGQPFGPVQSEQLPTVLYGGGWEGQGSYWDGNLGSGTGIDIIEPGTVAPDPLAGTITVAEAGSQAFSLQVMSPTGGANTRVKWKINGILAQDSSYAYHDTAGFTFTPLSAATYTVSAEVTENAGILNAAQTSVSKSTKTWTVSAAGYRGVGTELLTNGGFEAPISAPWAATNTGKSKRKCSDLVVLPYEGLCTYVMIGSGSTTAILSQKAATLGDAGDAFSLSAAVDSLNLTAPFSVTATFTFANGTTQTIKFNGFPRDQAKTEPYVLRESSLILGLDSSSVTKIKLQVKFSGAGGKVYADALSLLHYDEYLSSPPPQGGGRSAPLVPPPALDGFRGNN